MTVFFVQTSDVERLHPKDYYRLSKGCVNPEKVCHY